MAIVAYVGLPGHGKSYGVVENVIIPALQAKRKVFTNIPINSDVALDRYSMTVEQFDIRSIIENPNWWVDVFEPGSLIVLDEVWRLWPSGLKTNAARDQDKEFLAEHRHLVGENGLSTEVVLVTQNLSQIATFCRDLVETTFRVVKLDKIGFSGSYRVDVFFGAVTGANPPVSKRDREILGRYKKSVYSLYKSHTKSSHGAGDETRTDSRYKVLGGIKVKIGFFVFILALVLGYLGLKSTYRSYVPEKKVESASVSPVSNSTVPVVSNSAPVFKFLSKSDSLSIVWNNGVFPRVSYKFKVYFDDYEAVFTPLELISMDYKIIPVNSCMVRIKGPDYDGFAMCPTTDDRKNIFENLTSV